MSTVLSAGITPEDGLEILRGDSATDSAKEILSGLKASLEEGCSFADTLEKSGEFPPYAADLSRIGEKSGHLDSVSSSLASYYRRTENIREAIRSAVTYPLVMILMMLAVVGILIVRVLPIFNRVYQELGSSLTGLPKALLSFSSSSGGILAAAFAVLAALMVLIVILLLKNNRFRNNFFLSRKLMMKVAESRFADGMALTLSAGLDTDESVEMAGRLVDHPLVRARIEACRKYLNEGMNFAEAVEKAELFPGLTCRMIDIGVKSGTLEAVMDKIAAQYEEETGRSISRLLGILELTLVIVLSCVVGIILLSVMMPLLSIMSEIS